MALTHGFFNSLDHDRKYSAVQIVEMFDGLINDGVYMSIGTQMMVVANTGMIVNVGVGRAWFFKTWTYNDAILPLTVPTANIVLNRIDTVVLEVDKSQAVRANSIKIVSGVAATVPVKATLVNTAEVKQYPLAYIYVGAGVTVINQANITNAVGTSECPFVTGVMAGMNIDALIAQWDAEFDIWFQAMKDQLTTDAAGNLQNQINIINASLVNINSIKAPILSPDFTGEPKAPTASVTDNTKKLANTEFVQARTKIAPYGELYGSGQLDSAYAGKFFLVTTTATFTVPLDSVVTFPPGTAITFFRYGAGAVTISPASGVSILSVGNKRSIANQYEAVTLYKLNNANAWALVGALA